MSLEQCLELIEIHFDREQNIELLLDELADLEAEAQDQSPRPDFHGALVSFLERVDDLYSDEEVLPELIHSAIGNLRLELEKIRDNRSPTDPLEHLFKDMTRFESGALPGARLRTTLSRYEELVLALRHQFESTTPPTDESQFAQMMRRGLSILEDSGKRLRTQIDHDTDAHFDSIREQFLSGTKILREFRRKANFVPNRSENAEDYED